MGDDRNQNQNQNQNYAYIGMLQSVLGTATIFTDAVHLCRP
jgi:hypothetical protein